MKRAQSNAHEIESPSGIDLHPEPPSAVRLSKRAGIVGLVVAFGVVASLGYGIITRGGRSLPMGFEIDGSRNLTAATDAGKVIAAQIPNRAAVARGAADRSSPQPDQLQPPDEVPRRSGGGPGVRRAAPPPPYPPQANQHQ